MLNDDQGKIEQTLNSLLAYQTEKKFDPESILIALCLFNLGEMTKVLQQRQGGQGQSAASAGGTAGASASPGPPGDLQGLLGPLTGLIAPGQGQQSPLDLTRLLAMLGPLLGMGMGAAGSGAATVPTAGIGGGVKPVQREINLDHKIKSTGPAPNMNKDITAPRETAKKPKPGEVLEWKLG